MKMLRFLVACVCLSLASTAMAQTAVTAADLNKLDADVTKVQQQITTLKRVDPTLAMTSEKALTEIQEDLTYLKVKLRREGAVPPKDAADLRDRIETLRIKTQSSTIKGQPVMANDPVEKVVRVAVGTEMDVRM